MVHTAGVSEDLAASPAHTLDDVRLEGERLAEAIAGNGLALRMFGGVAVYLRCPSARLPSLERTYGDVDFVGLSSDRGAISDFFEGQGYAQDRMFNALHGARRLNFTDPRIGRPIDVVLDQFSMCHSIDLRDRLRIEAPTIPLADLLLTKLQVVELNRKDLQDLVAMLADHELGEEPGDAIGIARLERVLGDDWGFEHTVRRSLQRVAEASGDFGLDGAAVDRIRATIDDLVSRLDVAPKTLRWRMRAMVGERVRWYEVPEEARR